MRGRVDGDLLALGQQLAGQRVDLHDPLDLVPEELDAYDEVVVRRLELERVASHAEPSAREGLVVALVLQVDELAKDAVPAVLPADSEPDDGGAVVDRRAEAVDAADGRHDDDVPPLEQGLRGRVPELVDLVVAARVLLDVRVAAGQVRLGLVVVEVRDEILDGVLGEELAELAVQLGGQCLVVGQHQRGLLVPFDGPRQRGGLPGAGRSQQGLVLQPRARPSARRSMACGWSPVGWNGATS